jgi:hypothetical protein
LPGHALAALLLVGPLLAATLLLLAGLLLGALLLLASLMFAALLLARARIGLLAGVLFGVVRHGGYPPRGSHLAPRRKRNEEERVRPRRAQLSATRTKFRHELIKFPPAKAAPNSMGWCGFHAIPAAQFLKILQIRLYARS